MSDGLAALHSCMDCPSTQLFVINDTVVQISLQWQAEVDKQAMARRYTESGQLRGKVFMLMISLVRYGGNTNWHIKDDELDLRGLQRPWYIRDRYIFSDSNRGIILKASKTKYIFELSIPMQNVAQTVPHLKAVSHRKRALQDAHQRVPEHTSSRDITNLDRAVPTMDILDNDEIDFDSMSSGMSDLSPDVFIPMLSPGPSPVFGTEGELTSPPIPPTNSSPISYPFGLDEDNVEEAYSG